jgi:hypothetical protein
MANVGEVWTVVAVGMGNFSSFVEVVGAATSLAVAKGVVEDSLPKNMSVPRKEAEWIEHNDGFILQDWNGFTTYYVTKTDVVD